VKDGRVTVYGFVIMPNHIHMIWQIQDKYERSKVQLSFLRYIAQKIKFRLIDTGDKALENFKVKAFDREYQFWERNALSVDCGGGRVFMQKLNYIPNNPTQVHWKLCEFREAYEYSSFRFYESGDNKFDFLSHYEG